MLGAERSRDLKVATVQQKRRRAGRRLFARRENAVLVRTETNSLIELEVQYGLCRHFNFLSFRKNLRGAPSCCSRDGSNYSSFTAAGNRSQQSSEDGASPDHFGGALVFADSGIAFLADV